MWTGTRYGGEWAINIIHGDAAESNIIGKVWTERTEDPDVAADAARAWLAKECERLGLKIAHSVNHNDEYGPNERPYFTLCQHLLVDANWT